MESLEGLKIRLTNPERILYPDAGLAKRDLLAYYAIVGGRMLPYIRNRPLTLLRCPEGVEGECFFQKQANDSVPEAVGRIEFEEEEGTGLYVDSIEGLLSLVQIGALEIHVRGAAIDRLDRPNLLVLDVDPGLSVEWARVVETARVMRERLEMLGLESFVKMTGGKGLHVTVPIERRTGWEEAKIFTKALAEELVKAAPNLYTATPKKSARKGKIYVDYLRNTRSATAVAAYSTRALKDAAVAMPITWDELSEDLGPDAFTAGAIVSEGALPDDDPWEGIDDVRQAITKDMKAQVGMDYSE